MRTLLALIAGTAAGVALARLRARRPAPAEASPALAAPAGPARVAVDVSGAAEDPA